MSNNAEIYKFAFNADSTAVTGMSEIHGRKAKEKAKAIAGTTFTLEKSDAGAVVGVDASKTSKGHAQIRSFDDSDLDGLFAEVLEGKVATTAARKLEVRKFDIDASGNVTAEYEPGKRGTWKLDQDHDHDDEDESHDVQTVALGGITYVVKVEVEDDEAEIELFRDDNADGVWTRVAEFEGPQVQDWIADDTGAVDLTGVAPFLAAAVGVVG